VLLCMINGGCTLVAGLIGRSISVDNCSVSVVTAMSGVLDESSVSCKVGSDEHLELGCIGSLWGLLFKPCCIEGYELTRKVASNKDSNNNAARISSISCCHAMMLWLMASRLMGLHSIKGTAVAFSVVAVTVC